MRSKAVQLLDDPVIQITSTPQKNLIPLFFKHDGLTCLNKTTQSEGKNKWQRAPGCWCASCVFAS